MANFQIIHAAAGYYALWRDDEAERNYGRSPITAWHIETDKGTIVRSTAVMEGHSGTTTEAILCPDGTVNRSEDGEFWASISDWLASEPSVV